MKNTFSVNKQDLSWDSDKQLKAIADILNLKEGAVVIDASLEGLHEMQLCIVEALTRKAQVIGRAGFEEGKSAIQIQEEIDGWTYVAGYRKGHKKELTKSNILKACKGMSEAEFRAFLTEMQDSRDEISEEK